MKRAGLWVALIGFSLVGCIRDEAPKSPSTAVPEALGDGWVVSTPADHGMDLEAMAEVYTDLYHPDRYRNALALLVVHQGELVFETYPRRPSDRDRLHHVQSVAKSVTSLVLGIARADGYFPDLDASLAELAPSWVADHPDKQTITLRHLLTMRSGIAFDNADFSTAIYLDRPDDVVDEILSHANYAPAGDEFYYRDCDPHLVSSLIQLETGRSVESWASARLFAPLGIERHDWGSDPDGVTMGAHGLSLEPRDLARLGLLVLEDGEWEGAPLVPSTWLDDSTSFQTSTLDDELDYGWYWWLPSSRRTFTAWGHGGNFVYVAPEDELLIVMISMPDVNDDLVGTLLDEFLQLADAIQAALP